MNKPWKHQQTQDQLRIFISSRIEECSAERQVVRDAIRDLNHQPILFEAIGARPYPPRDLYLSRLSESHAMIAIYRLGYGYIDQANGMAISGLEDEYRFAKEKGIETLFYIWKPSDEREPRLSSLIQEVSTGPTVAFYDDHEKLGEFVKRDLTALITAKFLEAGTQRGVLQEDSSHIISGALSRIGALLPRPALINQIVEKSGKSSVVCIYGPAGIGKTTIAAQYANARGGIFLRASGLAPKEIFSACAGLLKPGSKLDHAPYTTLEGARLGAAAAWAEISEVELIVDECDFVTELVSALQAGGGFDAAKRLLFTSRKSFVEYDNVLVPMLTQDEVNQILAKTSQAKSISSAQLAGGTPLDVQDALIIGGTAIEDFGSISGIQGSSGEILKYLALAAWPLSAEELLLLRADDSYSIDMLVADIDQLGAMVDDSPRGYRIVHANTAEKVTTWLKQSTQQFRFFVNRLTRLAERQGMIRYAYHHAKSLQDGSENKFIQGALREAAQLGDWRLAIAVADEMLAAAVDAESKAEAFHLLLGTIYPLDLMGAANRATEQLEKARELAESLGEKAIQEWRECSIGTKARRALLSEDVAELQRLYDEYGKAGRTWDQARLGLELSAIYLSTKKHEDAVNILRSTWTAFHDLGDDYGIDLSERNLASALSALPGHEEETERLVASISARTHGSSDMRRQRAWLCNILVRRLRASGRFDEAEALAQEAITIAVELGDESLRALNLVNLGNVQRSKRSPQQAFEAYEKAAVVAKSCGRTDIEADASRLVAGLFNDFSELGTAESRNEKAVLYAQTAIGLLRGSVYGDAQGSAWRELAEAYAAQGKATSAIDAAFEAANAFREEGDSDAFAQSLRYGCHLALPKHPSNYLDKVKLGLGLTELPVAADLVDQFIGLVVPIIKSAPKGALISLLGSHLETAWSALPEVMQRGFAATGIEKLNEFAMQTKGGNGKDQWRTLYSAIAFASLMKNTLHPYLHYRLADTVTRHVGDIFAREEQDGSRVWTVVFNWKRRVAMTVFPLDDSPATSLACFVLAVFSKAFETELEDELIGSGSNVSELLIQVSAYDLMPADIKELATKSLGLGDILTEQPCVVSRPAAFDAISPTIVFLAPSFLSEVSVQGQGGNALEVLLGLALTELTFQMLRGEVEVESLRPKIVSLVHRARP